MNNGFSTNRELFTSNDKIKHTQAIMYAAYEFARLTAKSAKEFCKQNRIAYKQFINAIDINTFVYNYYNCVKEGKGLQMEMDIMSQMLEDDNKNIAEFNEEDLGVFTMYFHHHLINGNWK